MSLPFEKNRFKKGDENRMKKGKNFHEKKGNKFLRKLLKEIKNNKKHNLPLVSLSDSLFDKFRLTNPDLEKQLRQTGEIKSELVKDMFNWSVETVNNPLVTPKGKIISFQKLWNLYKKRYTHSFPFIISTKIQDPQLLLLKLLETVKELK